MQTDEIKHATISGAKWNFGKQFCFQTIALVFGIVLSRLLLPEEFGLLAMVMVFSRFGNIFSDMGLSRALIHKREISPHDTSTVFWATVILGFLLAGLMAALAPSIAWFYEQPELTALVLVIALNFILNSLNIIPRTLLEKGLRFRFLFFIDATATVLSGLIAIGMALNGYGVWSLVAQIMFRTLFISILFWLFHPWRPAAWCSTGPPLGVRPDMACRCWVPSSLNYWVRNADKLLIGRYLGEAELGYYNKPYTLMLFPLANITQVLAKVMFPSLAMIQDNKQLVKSAYLRVVRLVCLTTFPISIGVFVMAEPIILGLYGQQWVGSVEILRVLSLLGISQSVLALNGSIYQSQGATMLQFKWGLLFKLIIISAIVAGLPYGVMGIAIAYTAASLCITIPNLLVLGRVIPIRLRDVFASCYLPLLFSTIMGLVVYLFLVVVGSSWNNVVLLLTGVPIGMLVYAGLVFAFDRKSMADVLLFINNRRAADAD